MSRAMSTAQALSATLAFSVPVWAQGPPVAGWSLEWRAPAGCPVEAAVRAEVRSLLAGSTRADTTLSVSGDVLAVNQGFEVELRFASEEGPAQRVLTGRDCKEVAKAAALVIALAIDPGVKINPDRQSALEATPERPMDETSVPPPPATPAEEIREEPESSSVAPTKPFPLSIEALIGGVGEWGTLPELALALQAGASLGVGPWRATLFGHFAPARIYEAEQATRLRLSVVTGSLLLGHAFALGEHAVTPELGLQLGQLSASARDADAPTSADSALLSPQAGVRAVIQVARPLGVWLGLHSGLHLARPRLVVENRGVAHQPGQVWATGALGISLRWP